MSGAPESQRLESAHTASLPIGILKECFKCKKVKPINEFYKHPKMGDGHLGKCKECTKKDVSSNYADNREQYAEYEKKRFQDKKRKEATIVYQRNRRARNPEKYKANNEVGNALRDCRLKEEPCEVCGDLVVEAHHEDYSKPLDVNWLCRKHHLERHGKKAYVFDKEPKQ